METLIVERKDGVVRVTMNRPRKKNAMDGTMVEELRETFIAAERSPEDRCLVLTGADGDFCTGADLSNPVGPAFDLEQPGLTRMRRFGDLALALHQLSIPTIAEVDGLAVGAGLSLALGCDLVVASDRARFSAIFAKRGLGPDVGASWLLPRIVGMAAAKRMLLLAEMLDADEAMRLGLIAEVVEQAALRDRVDSMAAELAKGPTLALSNAKTLLNNAFATSMAQALEDEGRAQSVLFHSEDTIEAVKAFVQKRSPDFKGR